MNCQEVMDLMQRQLDGDLDDRETESLTNHLRHCPECSAMFDRLKLLSAGLDNLPKVTPKYSLVDAILPRLAEIQAAGETAGTESPESAEPIRVGLPPRRPDGDSTRQPRRRNRLSLRVTGGVVAAGIVVGLLLATHPFDSFKSQFGNSKNTADSLTAEQTSGAGDAAKMETFIASNDAPAAEAPKIQEKVRVSGEDRDGADSGQAASGDAASSQKAASDNRSGNSASADRPASGDDHATVKDQAGRPAADEGTDRNMSPNFQISGGSSNYDAAGGGAANSTSAGNDAAPAADGTAAEGGAAASDGGTAADSGDQPLSFAPAPPSPELVSPDQQYKAAVVDSKLKIYRMEDDVPIFESAERPGGIRNLAWTKDSKTFTYETTSADGKTIVYAVDPGSQSEQEKTE